MTETMPATPAFSNSSFGLETNSSVWQSPFTKQQQVVERSGAKWTASYTLPPMNREQAAPWIAFLIKMRGMANSFYGYDPDALTPLGNASQTTGAVINGSGQTGKSIVTDGWAVSTSNLLLPGDYFTINDELKMVTAAVNSDAGGNATITFEPALRSIPLDNQQIILENPYCTMRLIDDNQATWKANENGIFNISFTAMEVIL